MKILRKPLFHQEQAKNFLLSEKRAILADDMGGGKTCSSIIASVAVKGKKLVVCPASLKYNWKKEVGLVVNQNVHIIEKEWIRTVDDEWTIINYDLLDKYMDEIINENFSVMIADEVHYCRTIDSDGEPKSIRAKNIVKLSENIEYLFLLTGTPIVNSTKDIFLLLKMVGHPMSYSYRNFVDKYNGRNQDVLFKRLKLKMLRRLKHEFIDLPLKSRRFIPLNVELSDYEKEIEEFNSNKDDDNYLSYLNRLRMIVSQKKIPHTIAMAKDILDKGKPVVIFTNYNKVVNDIMEEFGDRAVKITGSESSKKRDISKEAFQNGEKDVIVCNLVAGSTGLTLTRASDLIVNDMSYVPADHLQAEDRIHRIGQDKACNIYYMYCEKTIDERMASMLEFKIDNMGKAIDNKEIDFLAELKEELI